MTKQAESQHTRSLKGVLSDLPTRITGRPVADRPADQAAVRALAQAAVNVELFTIPLYMCALSSIQGTHQINDKSITYFQGRLWPGLAPTVKPSTANARAYNTVFSIFIEEMLHLQMAANIANALAVTPSFTSGMLQSEDHGWTCYGPSKTQIPHIIDLADTKDEYASLRVNLDGLTTTQIKLFKVIEQPHEDARKAILPEKLEGYFPEVPFKNWTADSSDADLPMFGTIGWMYECFAAYLSITYEDGKTLWETLFTPGSCQRDLFNISSEGHPLAEYPGFKATIAATDVTAAFNEVIDMMSAITDQGEGSDTKISRYRLTPRKLLAAVKDKYQPSGEALVVDYPSYTDTGNRTNSTHAAARFHDGARTHFERFEKVLAEVSEVVTFAQWHNQGHAWSEASLKTADYDPETAAKNIPTPDLVAQALNKLKQDPNGWETLSQVAVGAIAGVTTVLNKYWTGETKDFPSPSMVGSGDRMSLVWAVFGKAPDLSKGIGTPDKDRLYHCCQGLDFSNPGNTCAAIEIYHTCRGSNGCKAQGGCGFVQLDKGGGNCSMSSATGLRTNHAGRVLCGTPSCNSSSEEDLYSAPSDNKCNTYGGCAVPISASQLLPKSGTMKLYAFEEPNHAFEKIGELDFEVGDSVYDKAWEAYTTVMQHCKKDPGDKPEPSTLRIALPPST